MLAALLVLGFRALPSSKPNSGPVSKPTPNAATTVPAEMVVWTSNFRIELISSTNGHVIRTLARDVGLYRGTPRATVSLSGTVYFDQAQNINGVPTEQILKVPLSGGAVSVFTQGHDPQVSPNGRLLAYLTYTDLSNIPEGIVVRDLLTGAVRKWEYSTVAPDIGQLSWAPDSKSLSFTTVSPPLHKTSLTLRSWVLDVGSANRSLDRARQIPLPSGMAWDGYLNQTEGIGVVQHLGATRQGNSFEVAEVDVNTGRIERTLLNVHGTLAVDNSEDGAEGTLQVDPSGRYLSIIEVGSGHGTLNRWTIGDGPIVQITTGVLVAAWAPVGCSSSGDCK
jgi:hypothetical protein